MNTMNEMRDAANRLDPIQDGEVRSACEEILASSLFFNAPRMNRLMRFLVDKAMSGAVWDTGEYSVGIEVFDRDPSTYNTSKDPIVRVQVGRLRKRLQAYYASSGLDADIEISIPVGSYMPVIRRRDIVSTPNRQEGLSIFPC